MTANPNLLALLVTVGDKRRGHDVGDLLGKMLYITLGTIRYVPISTLDFLENIDWLRILASPRLSRSYLNFLHSYY